MRTRIVIALTSVAVLASMSGPSAVVPAQGDASASVRATFGDSGKRCNRKCRRERRRERLRELRERRPFAPRSFWNAPLSADAPLDEKSDEYVSRLHRILTRHEPYVNTTRWSTPVYTVPADQRTVHVTLDNSHRDLQEAFEEVPIPRRARPALGVDKHMVVWQPSTDTMWEFWHMERRLDGWHAEYGGRMENVSRNPGHYTEPNPRWGATATSLPLLGGLMRLRELNAGRIDHALAVALPEIRADAFSWPAQRTDGSSRHPNAIPQGAHFRIDPRVDLSAIQMSPIVRAMARAVQRYGMVVRDGSGAVSFYAEDPTPTGRNPFLGPTGIFTGRYISKALRAEFPWQHLQVLRTDMTYEGLLTRF